MSMIIDAHTHLGFDRAHGFSQDRAALVERLAAAGVDAALASPFPAAGDVSGLNAALAKDLGGPILGAGLVSPGSPEATREIDRLIDDYGMRAALIDIESTFEYVINHGLPSPVVDRTFDYLDERSLPVIIHAHHPLQRFLTADLAVGIDTLARRYPNLPFIVSCRTPAVSLIAQHPNVYLETSLDTASPVDLDSLRQKFGAARVLFASNAPIEHPLVKRMAFERIDCSVEDRALMLGGAVAKLLGFVPSERSVA